jgi:hypothetical protein
MMVQRKSVRPLNNLPGWSFRRLWEKRDWTLLLIVALIILSILYLYSLKFNKNITGFMVIGDYFQAPQYWNPQTVIHKGSVGYDGQFYYYIAHDPFVLSGSYTHIDFPAYRYQRIIYPLTVWLVSFGQWALLPYMMVAVNFFSILLGTFLVIKILNHYGSSPWWSLLYPSFWGFLLCLLRCLPEPLAITFVVMAVYAWLKEKQGWQIISLSLAGLTQETTLLVAMAFWLTALHKKKYQQSAYLILPFLSYGAWQLYLFSRFGTFSFLGGTQNFGFPFWGLLQKIVLLLQAGLSYETLSELLYLAGTLVLIVVAFSQVLKRRNPLTLSFAGYALMVALLNRLIWVEPWSYGRATLGLLTFNLLIFTKEKSRINLLPALLSPLILLLSLISMKLL